MCYWCFIRLAYTKLEAPDTLERETTTSSTHIFTRETINAEEAGWFIHLSYTMPHDPMQVDEEYINDYPHCSKMLGWRCRIYCGMITCFGSRYW